MNSYIAFIAVVLLIASFPLRAEGWTVINASTAEGTALSYDADQVHYKFSCVPEGISVENFGVTQLLDVKTGNKIGDGPDGQITPGASYMALAVDKVEPAMVPANVSKNQKAGWDFRVILQRQNVLLAKLAKITTVSIFTSGYTALIIINKLDRQRIATFVNDCR